MNSQQKLAVVGKKIKSSFTESKNKARNYVILFVAMIGVISLITTKAAGFSVSLESELGSRNGCVTQISDSAASAGNAVQFGCSASTVGAKLPITYDLSSLTGNILYAAPNGSTSSSCSSSAPCTLSRAINQVTTANSTVVLRGGIYRDMRNITVGGSNKTGLRIIAYPKETPELYGSVSIPSSSGGGWTTEGFYQYRSYLPRPVQEGGGVTFNDTDSLKNLTGDGVGRYPDQVWIGTTPLKEVLLKSQLQDGKFFVDRTSNRLYLTSADAAKPQIESSRPRPNLTDADRDRLFHLQTSGVTIEGLRITRYAPNANDYGVITVENSAPNTTIKNVEVSNLPYTGIHFGAGNAGSKLESITAFNVGWQTIVADRTDNFLMDSAKITDTDFFDEFASSPASGALKTSRSRNTKVLNSEIDNNQSHGLWFDQSNINTVVANTKMRDNTGAGVFFEISDGLLFVNNYVHASGSAQALRMAGSSGIRMINNTSVGGANPLGVYTDSRSVPGCSARQVNNTCQYSINSDLQTQYPRPATLDWMPRIDYMINNIFAYPTGTYVCSSTTTCYTTTNASASAPIETVIHKADPTRGIPQTFIDGNVYANGSSALVRVSLPSATYTTVNAWTTAMAGSPVSISGIDANSKFGDSWVGPNGSPSSTLESAHNQAIPVPTETELNKYIPAGTQRYGVTYNLQ